jgi:hypothetical protein
MDCNSHKAGSPVISRAVAVWKKTEWRFAYSIWPTRPYLAHNDAVAHGYAKYKFRFLYRLKRSRAR